MQTKERKIIALTMCLGIGMTKSLKKLRMTRLRSPELQRAAGWPEHWGVELATLDDDYDKYTFSKVLQFSFSKLCFFEDSQVQKHVLSLAFANMLWQKYSGFPGFATFHKYDFAGFCKLSHFFLQI